MAEVHDWRTFDAETGLEARQITPEGEADHYQVRDAEGTVTDLTADEFAQLRDVGPNPKGL